ncbi:helix-turn-helix domain-containing protein [Nitriliruptor alkaliphilus]|uniref:helix-turn-helix domain-containing protein n=1 Tax=Nitriliruptor alkaliphilus TaxID=427918 RepID=UPI0009FA93F6|nr:GAF domain-containing protein [Nitriliruptor alkaliphilus]
MLLDEAPVEALEQLVEEARGTGADAARLEELRETSYLALQLRTVLRERRRRESELAALYATAGDLISIRAPQRVLQAIARRARELLDADTAYLTLIDEEAGDTYMRVTDGMVTPDFGRVRLPLGVGLGGLVAQTATPYFTSDYLNDDRFDHAGRIDEVVQAEDIRAILGVPLKLGDEVIGVLFAANRHSRPFTPDEVNLLSSLAAHAAIAIENARLFDRSQRALEELAASTAVVRAHSDAVERAAAVHERLTDIVLQGGSLDDVARAVAEVLGGTVTVLDPNGRPVAGGRDEVPVTQAALTEAWEAGRTISDERDGDRGWVTPVAAGADPLGALALRGRDRLDDADLRTFERAAQSIALLLLHERATAEAELRLRGELLEDLLSGVDRVPEVTTRRTRLLGVDLERPHTVQVASVPGHDRRSLLAAAARIAEDRGGLAAERHGAVVLLVPAGDDLDGLATAVGRPVTCGVAVATGLEQLPAAYEEADRCRRALVALGRDGEVARAADLGVFALLFNRLGREELERFVVATIGPVLDHDEARGTELTATLEAYFDAGGNLVRAAEALHVHVNTLYQRGERIARLLSPSWREPDEALQLHLALQVRRLQAALGE